MGKLTHLNPKGEAEMVDISGKDVSARLAVAGARVLMAAETLRLIQTGTAKKGDVLAAARIAGIMAAKKTSDLIPLCHPLALSKVAVAFEIDEAGGAVDIRATVSTTDRTGVEMEALTASSVAALTIYDMLKAADRAIRITDIRLISKSGGKSGDYRAEKE